MPHYYFDLINGSKRYDRNGLDCVDDAAAIVKAATIVEVVSTADGDNCHLDLYISIMHEDGHQVLRVVRAAPAVVNPSLK
jgi:hypothetical protein